ncbi:acyltransferase family protein [Pseudoduganella sp. FT55W]|uniref:Acyltransferase family protein n=1 Tax=Duganella rivi TaxID=2666083 RepID=A0A7X4K9U9_9BURK|nr:acyltransferase [Duganella rivi]MYM65272.1 acyltransferase family protein [Duganella rivi]
MLRTLQAGRALAAISVVAFHLSIYMLLPRYGGVSPFIDYTSRGHLGVDFFFVLSGFIILFAHERDIGKPEKWGHFAYRRFSRLFPVYWLYTGAFVFLVMMGFGQDSNVPKSLADWLTTITLVRVNASSPPLAPAWTLFHELQFYAVFSLLLLNKRLGMIAMAVLAVVAIALYHFPGEHERTALNVYTSAYSLYFLLGMAAYWRYKQRGKGVVDFAVGLALLAVGFWVALPYSLSGIVIAAGFAALIAGLTQMEAHYKFAVPKVLGFLGDASYSIYLTHLATMGLFLKIALKTPLYTLAGPAVTFIAVLVASLAAGGAAYYFVERPLLRWLQSRSWSLRLSLPTRTAGG